MTRLNARLIGTAMLALGIPSLYAAHFGALWQPGIVEYLGWFQLLILRPGLYGIGAICVLCAVWLLWFRWTQPGRVLRMWRECCLEDREMDAMYGHHYPDAPDVTLWTELGYLWRIRRCMWHAHDPAALWYSDGGEDGPRGTQCGDCGTYVSRKDVTPPRPVRVWPDALTPEESDRVVYGSRVEHLTPDCESLYGQGSDATVRIMRTDKEA